MWSRLLLAGFCCLAPLVGGCSSEDQPQQPAAPQPSAAVSANQPTEPPEPQPEPSPLLPESESWSREEALAKLRDEAVGLSAAVRLVRLADDAPLCLPDPLPAKIARRLRLVALLESRWALGLRMPDERRLASPVLIDAEGRVTLPVKGAEEEVALLCCAEDAELFPHLLITPLRVLLVGEELQSALVAKSPPELRFDLRHENGYPYVALIWLGLPTEAEAGDETGLSGPTEVARYTYDPYELAFMGPLSDKLPDPPGGLFELDLEQSEGLIPMGGVIPEPPKFEPPEFEPAEGEPTPY